jgi:hypothetical protein
LCTATCFFLFGIMTPSSAMDRWPGPQRAVEAYGFALGASANAGELNHRLYPRDLMNGRRSCKGNYCRRSCKRAHLFIITYNKYNLQNS